LKQLLFKYAKARLRESRKRKLSNAMMKVKHMKQDKTSLSSTSVTPFSPNQSTDGTMSEAIGALKKI
jgi:hypothetical protein